MRNLKLNKNPRKFHFQIVHLNAPNALFEAPKMEKLKFLRIFSNRFIYLLNITL